jgi:hypothetical protein
MAITTETLEVKDSTGATKSIPVHLDGLDNIVPAHSRDTTIPTYIAGGSIPVASMAASLTDLVGLRGSASKTVRVKKIRLEAGATTGLVANVTLKKHSVANTGGTLTATAETPLDSGDAAATAVALVYSANPTIDASAIELAGRGLCFTALTTQPGVVEFDFVRDFEHAAVLRGVAEEIVINFGGTTPGANSVLNWHIVWTEEDVTP